jgi:hypothetical protein
LSTANIASRLSTDTPDLQELTGRITSGEIKVPQFQRKFVWRPDQAIALLDSIANNYPVGSLLVWRTADKLATERNIGDFQLPETDDLTPTDYVLDGQQRLTVIYSCLGAPVEGPGFSAVYDLLAEEFLATGAPAVHLFPLRLLFRTTAFLNFRTALQTHPRASDLQGRLDDLVAVLTRYKIPVVTLKELTLVEVCPIFERINSSGTSLSTYDLMVAATWSREFDLNDRVEDIALTLSRKSYGEVAGNTVLKAMAACNRDSVQRESVLALRDVTPEDLDELVEEVRGGLLHAVDLLTTDFKVHGLDFLPYEAHLVVLAYTFAKAGPLSETQVRHARQWFWRSAFTEHYRGASEAFVSRDLEAIHAFVVGGSGDAGGFGQAPDPRALLRMRFRKNNSGSRAFSLALGKLQPRNITNGAAIDTFQALSVYNRAEFHHIWPQAFLKKVDPELERNYLLNICLLSASENNSISDDDPREYLPALAARLGEDAVAIFASNLLPNPESFPYSTTTYAEFLEARADVVHGWTTQLCAGTA